MLTKSRVSEILKLALPISVGVGSTFIMVLIDVAMIGQLGNKAVAALGLASFSFTLVLAFVIGVSPAVQGVVARRKGRGATDPVCEPLNAGLLLVLAVGIPLAVLFHYLTPSIFSLIASDPEVIKAGIPYLSTLFLAIVGVGMNAAFRGHWTGYGRAKVYMLIILFTNCLNIFLNYTLIYGNFGAPALGTFGAAISSVTSVYTGTLIYIVVTFISFKGEGFLTVKPKFDFLIRVYQTGLPDSMQEAFFSLGYVVFYWIVGLVGTVELAATNVLVRVTLVLVIFADALGVASATLVSNALGKGDAADAAEWGWDTGKIGVIWITLLGLPLFLFPEFCLSFFLTDPETIEMAIIPMQLTGALTGIASLIYIFAYTLVSLGDGNRVLLVSFATQWIFFLPAVWIVGPYLNYGLLEIWLVQVVYGLLATGLITALWHGGRWKKINL